MSWMFVVKAIKYLFLAIFACIFLTFVFYAQITRLKLLFVKSTGCSMRK